MVNNQIGTDSDAVSGEDAPLLKCEITTKNTLLSGHGGPAGSASATGRKCFVPVDGIRQNTAANAQEEALCPGSHLKWLGLWAGGISFREAVDILL